MTTLLRELDVEVPCPSCGVCVDVLSIVRNTFFAEFRGGDRVPPDPATLLFVHEWMFWQGGYVEDVSHRLVNGVRLGQRIPAAFHEVPQVAVPLALARWLGLDTMADLYHRDTTRAHEALAHAHETSGARVANATHDVAQAVSGLALATASPRAYLNARRRGI